MASDAPQALPIDAAADLYRDICQETYPDVAAAQANATAQGFTLNAATGSYERSAPYVALRITEDRCVIRFLTDVPRQDFLVTFASLASPRATSSNPGDVNIGAEPGPNGLLRITAIRNSAN